MAQHDIAQIASFVGAVVLLVPPLWRILRGIQRGLDRMDVIESKQDATNDHLITLNGKVATNTMAVQAHEVDIQRVIAYIEGQSGKALGEIRREGVQ